MIIVRAPLRISFAGGGTDFEDYFTKQANNFGFVIGCAIDKYVYVILNELSDLAKEKIRFTYRKVESVFTAEDIEHPVVRELLLEMKWKKPINIATLADLPGNTGLGSSSAFTVALATGLEYLQGLEPSKSEIVDLAILVERKRLREFGGVQDQLISTYGNFRSYKLMKDSIEISSELIEPTILRKIFNYIFLIPVSAQRNSTDQAKNTYNFLINDLDLITSIYAKKVLEISQDLENCHDVTDYLEVFSYLIRISHEFKLTSNPSYINSDIAELIKRGLEAGAISAKLCGAGGGGFVAFVINPKFLKKFTQEMSKFGLIKVKPDFEGCQLISY